MAAKDMDWTYPVGAGDSGIFEIGRRLAEALGRAPDATRFTYDPRAMMGTTRDIERGATGGRLLVGFQAAAKFDVEAERYRARLAAGTHVTAWAAGPHAKGLGLDELDYRALPPTPVASRTSGSSGATRRSPWPSRATSWVTRRCSAWGAAGPGKRFVGFVSDDVDVMDLLIRTPLPIGAPAPPALRRPPSASALELA